MGMKGIRFAACVLIVFGASSLPAEDNLSGVETWGGRKAHPAVVNPILGYEPGTVVSLAGEWDFITQPWRHNFWISRPGSGLLSPMSKKDRLWEKSRKLQVPGLWEDQGVGTNGLSICWDCAWDGGRRMIRHFFNGCGVYRREVKIPADWKGKRIWLKTGWAFACACFWVNGEQVAMDWNYCATVKYDITDLVKPGETALITAEVSNAFPSKRGNFSSHNRYGGLYRAPEIEATPAALIDDAWVRGDFDGRKAEVNVTMDSPAAGLRLRAEVEGEVAETQVDASKRDYRIPLALENFRPWSPECPNLYTAKVELVSSDGSVLQVRRERFGVRKFEARGKDIMLNNAPYFIRGVGFHNLEPIRGVRPADRDYIRRQFEVVKASGFNAMRLHTRCEAPEFFEMADEMGLLVQPETPYYGDAPCENFGFDPMSHIKELYVHYRRHPSFAFYSLGNEGTFGAYLDRKIHKWVKATDPDRIKINQDIDRGWRRYSGKDVSDLDGGPPTEWLLDEYNPDRPFICHEYLNVSVKANPRLGDQYTGLWLPPYTLEDRKKWLAKRGLTMYWGDRLQRAQHILQRYWRKRGIELARADRWCDGYWFWSHFDSTTKSGEAFSAQSLFDPFGNPKPFGDTAETFAVINSPSGVFAPSIEKCRVVESGDEFRVELRAAHFGEKDIADAKARWKVSHEGRVFASGEIALGALKRGGGREIGTISFTVPELKNSTSAELSVEVTGDGTRFANDWTIYMMAKRAVPRLEGVAVSAQLMSKLEGRYSGLLSEAELSGAKTLVASATETNLVERALAAGKRVVAIAPAKGVPNVKLGWWWMGSQVGTALADHPYLRYLPHDGALDPLIFRIVGVGRELPYSGMREEDMAIVGEGKNHCYLYLGEVRRGGGLVVVEGLNVLADLPEAKAILDGILIDEPAYTLKEIKRLSVDVRRLIDDGGAFVSGGPVTNDQGIVRRSYTRNGQYLHVFTRPDSIPGDAPVKVTLSDIPGSLTDGWRKNHAAAVDMRTGRVRRIERENIKDSDGKTTLVDVEIGSSPVLVTRTCALPFFFDWRNSTPLEIIDSLYCTGQYGNPMKNISGAVTNEPWVKMSTDEFLPCFDRYGQFKHRSWPGKVTDDSQLAAAAEEEEKDLARFPGPKDRNRYGGWKDGPKLRATGRFRPEKVDGKWWLVDPEGCLFWSIGPVRVCASCGVTPLNGDTTAPRLGFDRPDRDCFFEDLPPVEGSPLSVFHTTCDDLLRAFFVSRGETRTFDFSSANLYRKYGENYFEKFSDLVHRRMKSWGFNTIANGSDLRICLMDRTPYAERIETRSRTIAASHGPWGRFRDPWDESFRAGLRAQLEEHGREAHDPWCIGFFVDNEINFGVKASDLARWSLRSPADQPAKIELVKWLRRKYGTIEALNAKWGSAYSSWKSVTASTADPGARADEDLSAFTKVIVEEYFSRTRKTLKDFDEHILYLGCRFYFCPDWVIDSCARHCDIISYNIYSIDVGKWKLPKNFDKPVLVGEFHFGTRTPRSFGTGVRSVDTPGEQGEKFKAYVDSALRNPLMVGVHWHQYSDQAASGRFDGEGLQVGFTDICDRPHAALRSSARDVGYGIYKRRYSVKGE